MLASSCSGRSIQLLSVSAGFYFLSVSFEPCECGFGNAFVTTCEDSDHRISGSAAQENLPLQIGIGRLV
jgi:hypothetical protein